VTDPSSLTLAQKLWIYQRERFPLLRTGLLLAVFTAASINVSAGLAGRPVPGPWTFLVAWLATLMIFFQLRASDEVKDFDDDARYRPERPIPRGLVSLRLIVGLALACAPAAALIAASLGLAILAPLGAVWLWLGLMSVEFFAPHWLRTRPFVYLVSHMAIMPLIDLFVTSTEWLPHGVYPPSGLGWFLGLSFANGCVLEIGRKIWAPENEREGVETYSALLGPARATALWIVALGIACALLIGVGFAVGKPGIVGAVGVAALAAVATIGLGFIRNPTPGGQKRIDGLAGVWVLVCYATAGFAPHLLPGAAA
jgi:4-hydroxybenzoate polyprenyltransferase